MTRVVLLHNPFLPPVEVSRVSAPLTVAEIVAAADAPPWFHEQGVVKVDGHLIPRDNWRRVRVRPGRAELIELCVVPQKKILSTVAQVATVVLAAVAYTMGMPMLAAAVSFAGRLLINALSGPPSITSPGGGSNTPKGRKAIAGASVGQAGIGGNYASLLEPLQVVFGSIGFSPNILAPAYTEIDGEDTWQTAIVGCEGRNRIDDVLINGKPVDQFPRATVETFEGAPDDPARTVGRWTVKEQRIGGTLANARTDLRVGYDDWLSDQVNPSEALSQWTVFETDGSADEARLRLLFPGGILRMDTNPTARAVVPIRVEVQLEGTSAWRRLPVAHVADRRIGAPVQVELQLCWRTPDSGPYTSNSALQNPVWELSNITALGTGIQYNADGYFLNQTFSQGGILPIFTSATQAGITLSASSSAAGHPAWHVGDASVATFWQSDVSDPDPYLQVVFPSPTTVASYQLWSDYPDPQTAHEGMPLIWYVEARNGSDPWTRLDVQNINVRSFATPVIAAQVGAPGAYDQYRWHFIANNGMANNVYRLTRVFLYDHNCVGTALGADASSLYGNFALHDATGYPRCMNARTFSDGAQYFLDPAQWPKGRYKIRVKRGIAFSYAQFDPKTYVHTLAPAYWFEYRTVSGRETVTIGQKNYRSDCSLDVFQTWRYERPFDPAGKTVIAVRVPNVVIDSIYAEMTSYAPVVQGGVWSGEEVPTKNPAALYRKLLLGPPNPDPLPGEVVDEDELMSWYNRCAAAGHEVGAVVQSLPVRDCLQMLAACGYASPRCGNTWFAVQDYDTGAEPLDGIISPLNSRDLGTGYTLPDMPHALRAEYADAGDRYTLKQAMVYADGWDASTATRFETVTYDGLADAGKVVARAAFDLRQLVARRFSYQREMGIEAFRYRRGSVVGLVDDVLEPAQCYARVVSVQTAGGNVTGVTLDNVVPFSAGQNDLATVPDMLALADVMDVNQPMALAFDRPEGVLTVPVSTVTDGNVAIFTTPRADDGTLVPGLIVAAGVAGNVFRRCRVLSIDVVDGETYRLTLVDESPQLFN